MIQKELDGTATRDGFGQGLLQAARLDKSVVALSGDLNDSTRVDVMAKEFPTRFIQAGIAEQNMVAMAAGLSISGLVPFAASFGAFMPCRCFDQIRVSVALSNLNVKLAATHCGLTTGEDGGNAQVLEDIALMRSLPNFTVIAPADAKQACEATLAAAKLNGPVYLRLGREKTPTVTDKQAFAVGKAQVLCEGRDVAVIACGGEVAQSLQAAESLLKKGIKARVINMHTLKPIDEAAIIKAARECGAIITAEEHQLNGGLGDAVAQVVARNAPVPMEFVGVADRFGQSGTGQELLDAYGLTARFIEKAALKAIARKGN